MGQAEAIRGFWSIVFIKMATERKALGGGLGRSHWRMSLKKSTEKLRESNLLDGHERGKENASYRENRKRRREGKLKRAKGE